MTATLHVALYIIPQYFGPLHKLQGQKIDSVNKLITDNHFVLCFLQYRDTYTYVYRKLMSLLS